MSSLHVVIIEVILETFLRFRNVLVAPEINILVFDGPPQTLNKDIIKSPATAVHADLNPAIEKNARKLLACELTALIGIENLRLAILQSIFETLHAEIRRQRVRQSPGNDVPA